MTDSPDLVPAESPSATARFTKLHLVPDTGETWTPALCGRPVWTDDVMARNFAGPLDKIEHEIDPDALCKACVRKAQRLEKKDRGGT